MSSSNETWPPLPRAEVIKAIERKNPCRVPLVMARWWGEGLGDQYGDRLSEFDRYPQDTAMYLISPLDVGKMGLSWKWGGGAAHDARCVIDDWARLDEFLHKMPDPEADPQVDNLVQAVEKARSQDRYVHFGWWGLFFERPWGLRGMENLMTDFHLEQRNIHRLYDALCSLYCGLIRKAARILRPDGFWTSDDLGHQTSSMMSPETFHELLFPYYKRVGETLRDCGMHFWLHSCGDNTPLMEDLITAGVDVFHPVQKGTMDEKAIAAEFGDRIAFLAGFDVQHILQEETPERVRQEVRHLIDTFDRPEGGLCMAAGNGIVRGTPFENIEAFLDESVRYGTAAHAKPRKRRREAPAPLG
jgi:uroporphyrinogen decarboxylase